MNLMSIATILLNIMVMVVLWLCLFDKEDLPMMVGVLCGAVTNTPGLGAANEALSQVGYSGAQIANGYACAYPLGVVGIIGATILIRFLCRIKLDKEKEALSQEEAANQPGKPHRMYVEVTNPAVDGITIKRLRELSSRDFVCSRIHQNEKYFLHTFFCLFLCRKVFAKSCYSSGTMTYFVFHLAA